jgi:hypothetical protein
MWNWSIRFPAGTYTTIAYDPSDPGRTLFAGNFTTAYARVIFASRFAALVLFAGVCALWLSRRLLPKAPAELSAAGV